MKHKQPFADVLSEKGRFKGLPLLRITIMAVCVVLVAGSLVIYKNSVSDGMDKINRENARKKREIRRMVGKVQKLEHEIADNQYRVFKLLFRFKEETGQELSYLNLLNLSKEEKKLLEKRIKNEKRVSVKSLLSTILGKMEEIAYLQEKMNRLESKLPAPVVVAEGQNHTRIALEYLTGVVGLSPGKADDVVRKTILCDYLVPGFKVWNYYMNGDFGTYVTQGNAAVSPGQMQRMFRHRIMTQKQEMKKKNESLTEDVVRLTNHNAGLNGQLVQVSHKHEELSSRFDHLNEQYETLATSWNSMLYSVDHEKDLIKQGVIKRGFLGQPVLKEIAGDRNFFALDLRKSRKIHVNTSGLMKKKIRDVNIYPRFIQKDVDYRVSLDEKEKNATLTILNPEKLKNERVLIAVK